MKQMLKKILPNIAIRWGRRMLAEAYFIRSRFRVSRLLARDTCIRLEIGSGDRKGSKGWVTLDIIPTCDICWDLARGLPFPDKSVETIYSSHVLEHFTHAEGKRLLDECMRVLIQSGEFLVAVPDASLYINAYARRDDKAIAALMGRKPAARLECVNWMAYMDGHHKTMFDEEMLITTLRERGFTEVRSRAFNAELDLASRRHETIYAGARKPRGTDN